MRTITPKRSIDGRYLPYKPRLELNLNNDRIGDLVSGRFERNPNFPAEQPSWSNETRDLTRRDFIPDPSGKAFLARLRRSEDPSVLLAEEGEGASSIGPQLPLLLGRGSLIAGGDPSTGYSPRHHGITVRATAIAAGRPVLAVGRLTPADL